MKLIWILAPLLVANLSASATHKKSIAETYGQIPLYFEAIQGQVDSQVRFLSRGATRCFLHLAKLCSPCVCRWSQRWGMINPSQELG